MLQNSMYVEQPQLPAIKMYQLSTLLSVAEESCKFHILVLLLHDLQEQVQDKSGKLESSKRQKSCTLTCSVKNEFI